MRKMRVRIAVDFYRNDKENVTDTFVQEWSFFPETQPPYTGEDLWKWRRLIKAKVDMLLKRMFSEFKLKLFKEETETSA